MGALASHSTSIQNNCAFWRFRTHCQTHAFSSANPRKPAFPRIDPRDCKTSRGAPISPGMVNVITVMIELERAWGHALPGHETGERDHVLRELQRLLQQQPVAHEPVRLRVIRS